MKHYVIINTSNIFKIDFSEFLDDNENTLTKNVDGTLCILKFKGEPPSTLTDVEIIKFDNREFHNHTQIIELKKIVSSDSSYGWVKNIEI